MVTFDSGQVHTEVLAEYSIKFDEKSKEELLVFFECNVGDRLGFAPLHGKIYFPSKWKRDIVEVQEATYCGDIKYCGGLHGIAVWLRLLLGNRGCLSRRPTTIH